MVVEGVNILRNQAGYLVSKGDELFKIYWCYSRTEQHIPDLCFIERLWFSSTALGIHIYGRYTCATRGVEPKADFLFEGELDTPTPPRSQIS